MKQGQYVGKELAPCCGQWLDGFTNHKGGRSPKPGDFSLCVYCQAFLEFTVDGLKKADMSDIPDAQLADLNAMRLHLRRA
jgi:hypothetical protein